MSFPNWLAEAFADAQRQWAELPEWARPVYCPPADPTPTPSAAGEE